MQVDERLMFESYREFVKRANRLRRILWKKDRYEVRAYRDYLYAKKFVKNDKFDEYIKDMMWSYLWGYFVKYSDLLHYTRCVK